MIGQSDYPQLYSELQRIVDGEAAVEGATCVLRVEVSALGYISRHASGGIIRTRDLPIKVAGHASIAVSEAGKRATPDTAFRTASVTKTFTAAVIVQLVAERKLALDDKMYQHLPREHADLVDKLHVLEGKSYGRDITVRHLLAHSSGLFDYAMSKGYGRTVLKDPGHVWTPRELLESSIIWGKPHFAPDLQRYAYSDTNYVLLGLIVEHLDGKPLHESYRARILDPLGMENTYLEGHEQHRGSPMSHPYQGDFDAAKLHGSTDWAGGGLVSTVDDLAIFVKALFAGSIVNEPFLSEMMDYKFRQLDESHSEPGFLGYGLGVHARLSAGIVLQGHRGYWGVLMLHSASRPDLGITITGTFNQTNRKTDPFADGIAAAIKKTLHEVGVNLSGNL
jgi:D-alanyl-D-alanine carboxypeptidase